MLDIFVVNTVKQFKRKIFYTLWASKNFLLLVTKYKIWLKSEWRIYYFLKQQMMLFIEGLINLRQ